MSGQPVVSVIVPIYNQENYLRRCVDTIVNQDHSNLQIILVDDGSTDNSSEICDNYAQSDARITVIHKTNGGLSSARNAGMDIIKGEYVVFIDSDDWVEMDMISYLLSKLRANDADISICGHYVDYGKKRIIEHYPKEIIIDSNTAIKMLVEDIDIRNYVWNKMYKANILEKIRFNNGMKYEDIGFTYKTFLSSSKIVLSSDPKYHYFMNINGIVHTTSANDYLDGLIQIEERYLETMDICPSKHHIRLFNSFFCSFMSSYDKSSIGEKEKLNPRINSIIFDFIDNHYDDFITSSFGMLSKNMYRHIMKKHNLDIDWMIFLSSKMEQELNIKYKYLVRRINQ